MGKCIGQWLRERHSQETDTAFFTPSEKTQQKGQEWPGEGASFCFKVESGLLHFTGTILSMGSWAP